MTDQFLDQFQDLSLDREFAGVRLPELTIDRKHYKELKLAEKVLLTIF